MISIGSFFNAVGPEAIANHHGQTEQLHQSYMVLHSEEDEVRVYCDESIVVRSPGPSGNWVQFSNYILHDGEAGEGYEYEVPIEAAWEQAVDWDNFTKTMENEIEAGVVFSSPL